MLTVSVPTSPDAELPSPYEIFQVSPVASFQVEDLDGSKTLWFFWSLATSSVEKTWLHCQHLTSMKSRKYYQLTQRSEEPVSKSNLRV